MELNVIYFRDTTILFNLSSQGSRSWHRHLQVQVLLVLPDTLTLRQ